MRRRLRFNVPWAARCAAAVAVGAAVAGGAQAFFFKGWPGDGIPREPTLLPPDRTEKPPGGIDDEPPRWEQPPVDQPPKRNPPGVPEPATAALAAAGLGALALARRRMRR